MVETSDRPSGDHEDESECEGDREHLIPAALMRDVDLEARRVVAEILPGLLEED